MLCEDNNPLVVGLLVSLVVAHCTGVVHIRRCSYTEHLSLLLLASVSYSCLIDYLFNRFLIFAISACRQSYLKPKLPKTF